MKQLSYIDYAYYKDVYHGTDIPSDEFERIAEIASMIADAIVYCTIDPEKSYMESVKKAVAYEADTIYAYGGASVAFGTSDAAIASESLDGYSYSLNGGAKGVSGEVQMLNGIPVSPIVVSILSNAGLRQRWAYAYCEDGEDGE